MMAESRRPGHRSSAPQTLSELQLYRVLERANLLPYYANFIHQGGDDVQQLCEAGEDEFLEIMSLVGMGSKPLHVRRLQKALQEWVSSPGAFQEPLPAQQALQLANMDIPLAVNLQPHGSGIPTSHHPSGRWQQGNAPASSSSPSHVPSSSTTPARSSPGTSQQGSGATPPSYRPAGNLSSPSQAAFNSAPIGRTDNPVLSRETAENIRATAERVIHTEGISPMPLNKKITREVEYILRMSPDHPNRMEEIHKWSSIYGRFDSKRKLEKPLTLHEVTVNEAAAQLCNLDPHLILQREKLFPLARQVVRDSGYQYRHGQSRAGKGKSHKSSKSKRAKLSQEADLTPNPRTVQAEIMKIRREERMNEITTHLGSIKTQQYDLKAKISIAKAEDHLQKVYDLQLELEKLTTQQLAYMTEQTDLIKKQKRSDRYYVAKAKAEVQEDGDGDEGLLHDDSNSLLHEDQQQQPPQQQQQQQQQHQQQHHQPQQHTLPQQPQQPQHMQQAQPHPDRRSKCSSPPAPMSMKQEDHGYGQDHNSLAHPHQPPHPYNQASHSPAHPSSNQHHGNQTARQQGGSPQQGRRPKSHQGSNASSPARGSPRQPSQPPTSQHYNPAAADHAVLMGNGGYPHVHAPQAPADAEELSHTGLPKRAAYKAQRQMMQHLLMDEGYRLAQTFGTYQQPPLMNFPPNMNDGSHGSHGSHPLLEQHQHVVCSQPQPMTLLQP